MSKQLTPFNVKRYRAKLLNGSREIEGYYVFHVSRQICVMGDCLKDDDVHHCLVFDSNADWNMPQKMQVAEIDASTMVEVE